MGRRLCVALLDGPRNYRGGGMLQKLAERQAECLEAAARCRGRADATSDPIAKQDFLKLAQHWEILAHSFDFTQRLLDFLASPRL
jgi:hypothetical protein